MIGRIEFKDCYPFADATAEFAPTFNVVTGPNGSGKSLLLEAIYSILCFPVSRATDIFGGISKYMHAASKITLTSTHEGFGTLICDLSHSGARVSSPPPDRPLPGNWASAIHALRSEEGKPTVAFIGPFRGSAQGQQIDWDLPGWRSHPTHTRFGSIRTLIDAIQDESDDLDKQFKETLGTHFQFQGLNLISFHKSRTDRPNRLVTDVVSLGAKHELGAAADGCLEVFFIVAETFTLKKALILIDEPELHLHPRAQDLMARYLHHLTTPEGGENQVIVATHSLSFIYGHDGSRVMYLRRDGDGRSTIETIIDNGEPKQHYDAALQDLGYSLAAMSNAMEFHKKHGKPYPFVRNSDFQWDRPF